MQETMRKLTDGQQLPDRRCAMKGRVSTIVAALAFSGAAAAAGVQYGTEGTPQGTLELTQAERELFQAIDRDGDGYITRNELLTWFEEHDRLGDDRLSQAEFAAFVAPDDVMRLQPTPEAWINPHTYEPAVPLREPTGPEIAVPERRW
jgi:hypothetical protein